MKYSILASVFAAVQSAAGHAFIVQANGNPIPYAIRFPPSNSPVQNVQSADIACNVGGNTPAANKLTVAAGSSVKLTWRHERQSSASDVIDSSHKGPVIAYMKKVGNSAADSGVGAGWFKVAEDGYSGGQWAVDKLIAAGGVQSVTIPSCIAPGDYLLRGEIIALHAAGSQGQAQFYMECVQITVTGASGAKTPSTVSLPGAYSATDPGILVNIYGGMSSGYKIPGPAVFKC